MNQIQSNIDHLILGISDLTEGQNLFYELTGVPIDFGGTHAAYGTQNAIASLGELTYLEIIAPQAPSIELTGPFKGYHQMETLTPCGWAIATQIEQIRHNLADIEIPLSPVHKGTRKTGDGQILSWKALFMLENGTPTVNPFFLQWDDMAFHPAKTANCVGEVAGVLIEEGNDEKFKQFLEQLNLPIRFVKLGGKTGTLRSFTLDSSQRTLEFRM